MAESSSSAFDRTLETIGKCEGYSNFREWEPKIRMAIGGYKPKMLAVLDGQRRPAGAANAEAWTETNNQLFSVLFFMTAGSAHITVKTFMSKTAGGMGNGISAWKALKERFDGNTKQARRVAREDLFRSRMEEHAEPEDFFAETDRLRDRLKDMGEEISDEVYESLLLDALPRKFEFIRHRHYEDDSLDTDSLKKTAIAYNMDMKNVAPRISGPGMAMTTDTGTGSCCKECGNCKTDGQTTKKKWKKGKKKGSGDGQPKWCSYHNTTTHSDDECHKQKELKGLAASLALLQSAGNTNNSNVGTANLAQHQGSEPSTFGFSFSAMRDSLAEVSETPSTERQDNHLPDGFFGAF